ncbi:unannotated protein [freshwater metagenome]|uniref:Unannotated protein n=1 Tax=freshwater metagenome TaxID=449393 RepID=A0A6J6SWY8_9ZZZZ
MWRPGSTLLERKRHTEPDRTDWIAPAGPVPRLAAARAARGQSASVTAGPAAADRPFPPGDLQHRTDPARGGAGSRQHLAVPERTDRPPRPATSRSRSRSRSRSASSVWSSGNPWARSTRRRYSRSSTEQLPAATSSSAAMSNPRRGTRVRAASASARRAAVVRREPAASASAATSPSSSGAARATSRTASSSRTRGGPRFQSTWSPEPARRRTTIPGGGTSLRSRSTSTWIRPVSRRRRPGPSNARHADSPANAAGHAQSTAAHASCCQDGGPVWST